MMKQRIKLTALPDSVLQNLASRDAALWIGPGLDSDSQKLESLRKLIELPWQIVLCESTSGALVSQLEQAAGVSERLTRKRGFVHVVTSDPEELELPPRALPVMFLNGRDDAAHREDSSRGPRMAMQRRRLNMIYRLRMSAPRLLFALSSGDPCPLEDIFGLWEEGFRASVVVLSTTNADDQRIDEWLKLGPAPAAVEHCIGDFVRNVSVLVERASVVLPEDRYVVRMRLGEEGLKDIDITECELIEQPIFDRYELIQSRDLPHLEPDELSADDVGSFFGRSKESWRPFAAGLPWERNLDADERLMRALKKVEAAGSDQNRVLIIASESGAGGTTRARTLAHNAAKEGYPTLVARPVKFQPKPTELETFLYRVRHCALASTDVKEVSAAMGHLESEGTESTPETPWLIVYDVQHWEGRRGELLLLSKALTRSGRPVVLLVVTDADIGDELQSAQGIEVIDCLRHELDESDVLSLGRHLNQFLTPFGKAKTESQWRYFWEKHRPLEMETEVASFWIALEFWLKGQFDLSESIQQWVARHFREADIDDSVRIVLLEIAALSVERQPYPEVMLPPSPDGQFPYSVILSDVRSEVPALALVCDGTPPGRQWAMAHDLIGRYLVSAVYFDRLLVSRLGFEAVEDPVHLRLTLLRRIATRKELARKMFATLAAEFAVNILKLGTDGNLEFSKYWRQVLEILEDMPRLVWESNRTFNHHVAVSRRRVATTDDLFNLSLDEKFVQLTKAVEHLEYALTRLERTEADDESDLNLLNSLSLAYQNLADVEHKRGASETRLRELREKATETARRAQQEDPTNSYVLETFARNLLQNGRLYPHYAPVCAAEALGYIYQAMSLDRSLLRESKLTNLANESLHMLRSAEASQQLDRVCASGNPLGFLGKAWLVLCANEEQLTREGLVRLPSERLTEALSVIDQAPSRSNALLLRFRYDLLTVSEPRNFQEQLNLLDELEGTGSPIPLQLELEHAILLHQMNRHPAANIEFKHIRQQLRTQDVYADVPPRLRWLLTEDGKRRTCNARVVETRDYRAHAKVRELKEAIVPFIPQEFGQSRMPPGMAFTCSISFGAMGPFIKPPAPEEDKG